MQAKIYNKRWWISSCDSEQIKHAIEHNLIVSGFSVLGFIDHQFQPHGYTSLWLLGESHCAVHTFPEEEKSYIELSSCIEALLMDFDTNMTVIAEEHGWRLLQN